MQWRILVTVLTSLFGWLLPAKSQSLVEIDISFSQEQVFTPAFVATCLRPVGYLISFEEEEGILVFENEDKGIAIRLSSMTVGSDIDPASAFNSSKNVSTDETILNLDEATNAYFF